MGIFSFLRSISDGFFDALSDNTKNKALNDAGGYNDSDFQQVLERQRAEKEILKKALNNPAFKQIKKELKLEIGISRKELRQLKGMEEHTVLNNSGGKEIAKLYYGKKKNRLGNDSYDFEVTLKDGKVTGWKDLTNVGTRNK